ncbi:hypothetical protein PGT21_030178 [Puccinia graminis f. sp. tritici]|uniref:Uncharacterized protein n=2 Tax=Puccinia graminis f. sp. tritici TaxID=56615 RepID=E3K2Y4_PUCGT|nr:uncharacterized protein PGTG_04260 [Puccinia graminis f. sp. tritici CRL 75-36-700-3]EFP78304.1 hypothetical protein PGTG_04260 [Puccinia graminis f. sp. tritici CRL 75-36-700-3]KAA1109787.1 hypothetical protein PGTUg99_035047 [Puccinia graminis f. sp. tritici]KAA1119615.1 hypothetical protein PGT21_030178 [Puccinia graminis f. sp. tritici]
MLNATDFRRFKSDVQQHLQLEAQRKQQHEDHVEEIDSTFHHLNQHPSATLLSNRNLKGSANELRVACALGSRTSNRLLESSCQIMEAFHDSLLRRTIAINLEYELKRQLFPTLADSSPQRSQSSFMSVREAKKEDPERAKRILKGWFTSRQDEHQFWAAMHILKSVSSSVHPTNTIKGDPMNVSTTCTLLEQDFLPATTLRDQGRSLKWDRKKKQLIRRLVTKLGQASPSDGNTTFLHSRS